MDSSTPDADIVPDDDDDDDDEREKTDDVDGVEFAVRATKSRGTRGSAGEEEAPHLRCESFPKVPGDSSSGN